MKSLLYILTAIGLFLVVFFSTMLIQLVRAQPFTLEDEAMLQPKAVASTAPWAPTNAYTYYKNESLSGSNGDPVSHWADSAAVPHDAWVGVGAPVLTNNSVGGKPAVWWTNSTTIKTLTNAFGSTLSQPITLVMVINTKYRGDSTFLWDGIGDGSARLTAVYGASALINYGLLGLTAVPIQDTWAQLTICYTNGGTYVRTNGLLAGSGNAGTAGTKGFTIGNRYTFDIGSSPIMGIAEWIMYLGQPATNDLIWSEKGLCNKFGLTYYGP